MEAPADKRARVLSPGPRRKRETPEAAAQQRAYKKPDKKVRLEPEVKEIAEKCREIKKLQESIKLVDCLKADRLRPYHEAKDRLTRAEKELEAARAHYELMETMSSSVDMADLVERQDSLYRSIGRLREDIEQKYKKLAIDSSHDSE